MLLAVLLVGLSSFLAILFSTAASKAPYSDWEDGYFVRVASEVGGPWLGASMMFASAITNIGLFEAEMSSDSLQIAGMADRGILPKFLGLRSEFDTPVYSILMSAVCVIFFSRYDFSNLVAMLNLLFCFGQAIEFLAFLHLRVHRMDIHRPFMIPLSYLGCVALLIPPFIFMGIIVYFSSLEALILCSSLIGLGVGLYFVLEYMKENKVMVFEDSISAQEALQNAFMLGSGGYYTQINGASVNGSHLKEPLDRKDTHLFSELEIYNRMALA